LPCKFGQEFKGTKGQKKASAKKVAPKKKVWWGIKESSGFDKSITKKRVKVRQKGKGSLLLRKNPRMKKSRKIFRMSRGSRRKN